MTDYVGPGYSILTDEAREAMELVGGLEGILLDPVYTSKAMAGLIDHVRQGIVPANQNVVFLHTGGLPALFACSDTLGLEGRIAA
jgi:1-aminocyclopropane-1-carboxylate deaminase/D-cysteine desulfhydrase-like pyridoxal-dependent ACC family enzyme